MPKSPRFPKAPQKCSESIDQGRAVLAGQLYEPIFFRKDNSVTLGRNHHRWDIFQYPLKLHWSFALLLAYVLFNVVTNDSFTIVGIVAFLFLCVVLHEHGHALMAKDLRSIPKI